MDDIDRKIDDFFNKMEEIYELPVHLERERMELRVNLRDILDFISHQQ